MSIIPLKKEKWTGDNSINNSVKERLRKELSFIIVSEGISLVELKKHFKINSAKAQRDMKRLKDIVPKTGKIILTEKGQTRFQN